VRRQGPPREGPGQARDNGLERELKEGILAAGQCLGWNARGVDAFVVAVTGQSLEKCRHHELNRVLVAYVELARMIRTVAVPPGHGAVADGGTEVI
jgi:hypothetical protein